MQQDFSRRISIVINKNLPAWQALNALGHISAHFGHFLTENYSTGEFFSTQDQVNIPRNTQYPIIVFEGDNESVKEFANRVRGEDGVEKMYFVKEMVETSNDDEIQTSLSGKNFEEVEFLGVGIFGENSQLKSLTNGLRLWS